jgi:hypothetical protein
MSTVIEDELYQGYLTKVYQHTQGYQNYTDLQQAKFSRELISITYGELLYYSVKKILKVLEITPEDIFLDLGSGIGKCALQVFMQSDISAVIGIEASSVLHEAALKISLQVRHDFPIFWENNRKLKFIEGNFLNVDWENATIVYTCSTCFTQELLVCIANKINQTSSIKQVLSLRPLPTLNMTLKKVFAVECSWDSALCFLYTRF